jgi:Xaa-Pro aminopeptidase
VQKETATAPSTCDVLFDDKSVSFGVPLTRTFPINGRFSPEQRALYEVVLSAQLAAVDQVKPGNSAEHVHETAVRVLVPGLRSLGLLKGDVDGLIEQGAYRHLYMHRTGHWLGLDVHDVGAYRLGEHHVELEEGMVLTVEPGLYVSDRLPVPEGQPAIEERWKGIGIRIEDDVAVTDRGHENLTASALKAPAAMER